MKLCRVPIAIAAVIFATAAALSPGTARAQSNAAADPVSALSAALSAACRANETQFANYLTTENKTAFLGLPYEKRRAVLTRLSLSSDRAHPIIAWDDQKCAVLHCQAAAQSAEFHFGEPRVHE